MSLWDTRRTNLTSVVRVTSHDDPVPEMNEDPVRSPTPDLTVGRVTIGGNVVSTFGMDATDRLMGDIALADALRGAKEDDEHWIEAVVAFSEYAYPHLVLYGVNGELRDCAARVGARGLGVVPRFALDRKSSITLAEDMIKKARRPFRTRSLDKWCPAKGPLSDYFEGCCLHQLPRAWTGLGWAEVERSDVSRKKSERELVTDPAELLELGTTSQWYADPADIVARRMWAQDVTGRLAGEDEDVLKLAELKAEGYSELEALKVLRGSGLKSRSHRLLKKVRRTWGKEDF